jgi:preprotein translocase subunit SecG
METILLVVHVLIAIVLVGVVLLQRSEGGALGIGGGGGGGAMSSRGAANLLTRTTAALAAAFMVTSILLAIVSGTHTAPASILDSPLTVPESDRLAPLPDVTNGGSEGEAPASTTPSEPAAPISE